MADSNCRLPPTRNITDDNLADSFFRWNRQLEVYMFATGTTEKPEKQQKTIILNLAGEQMLEVYDNFTFDNADDKNKPEVVF